MYRGIHRVYRVHAYVHTNKKFVIERITLIIIWSTTIGVQLTQIDVCEHIRTRYRNINNSYLRYRCPPPVTAHFLHHRAFMHIHRDTSSMQNAASSAFFTRQIIRKVDTLHSFCFCFNVFVEAIRHDEFLSLLRCFVFFPVL